MYNNELYHHGIKGQRWGIRRYQNADGSLTSAGKARYNEDGTKKDPRKMSDEELRTANTRLQAEQNYRQLTGSTQPDKAFVTDTAIKIGASVVGAVGTTLLVNKLSDGNISTGKELADKILLSAGTAAITAAVSSVGGGGKKK